MTPRTLPVIPMLAASILLQIACAGPTPADRA
jgi:hypothetical protein